MPEILHSNTFVERAAQFILEHAQTAVAAHGAFRLALSGGNTPRAIYEKLAALAPDTTRWIITFGDERCVPPDHPQSNYGMAASAWLNGTAATVLRMKGELPPVEAALDYEQQLDAHSAGGTFRHDLVLLGMGDDGHTASLFPGTTALGESTRRVIENFVPKLDVWRLTYTFPFLNLSRNLVFLVNDATKQPLIDAILAGGTDFPSENIRPLDGKLTWLIGG